jgi:hypothetical protein
LLKTAEPVPVSSVKEVMSIFDVPDVATLEEASKNKALDPVNAERLMVASDKRVMFAPPSITISPVEEVPRLRVCILVVPKVPLPVKKAAVLAVEPAIVAVGVPPATLVNANLAEAVEVPPRRTSTVLLYGAIVPALTACQ